MSAVFRALSKQFSGKDGLAQKKLVRTSMPKILNYYQSASDFIASFWNLLLRTAVKISQLSLAIPQCTGTMITAE